MKIPIPETLITCICVAVLCGLGTWQLNRLTWKEHIIAGLQSAYDAKETSVSGEDLDKLAKQDTPFKYGTITAKLIPQKSAFIGPKTQDGDIGYHLLIPGTLPNQKTLFINAGFVSEEDKGALISTLPQKTIQATGLIRKSDWSSFASKNSPANDLWFRADINEIAQTKNITDVYPFILYADTFSQTLKGVKPHEKGWLPRNKHAQYAAFWFSMGFVLLVIYGLYIYTQNKKGP